MGVHRSVPCELCNLCMVTNGDRVLVLERTDENWKGVVFPGGHVETDESITDSVIREVREESGLTVIQPKLIGVQDWQYGDNGRYMVFFYRADAFEGELKSSEEGKVRWVKTADLHSLQLAPIFEEILRVFEDTSVSEMYHAVAEDGEWKIRYQ